MPIYEYQCESCGHRQDALQRISDDPLVDCAACGQPSLRKLMSAPRFRLKGSGWYETDFKSDNKRNLADGGDASAKASGEASGDGAGKASGDAKGDKQPAKTPEKKSSGSDSSSGTSSSAA